MRVFHYHVLPLIAVLAVAGPSHGENGPAVPRKPISGVTIRKLLSTATTSSGDPIVLPASDVRLTAATYTIAPGATLPVHKHPFPRFGYVLCGKLRVVDIETGRAELFGPGSVIVEMVGRWHAGQNVGAVPAELLVIDLAAGDVANTLVRDLPSSKLP